MIPKTNNILQRSSFKLPLTFEEIVTEIARFTSFSKEEVAHRVWMQALQPGWNVLQDVEHFEVIPHHYNDKMQQLYQEGEGFIFETMVFWAKSHRKYWIEQTLNRLQLYATKVGLKPGQISILMLGDGTGNDSLYVAEHGFLIDYYDVPGSKTFDFALRRFEHYGLLNRQIKPVPDYQACLKSIYDAVISFEVLEHLPNPEQAIQDIGTMLKINGIALITEDFGDLVTHLPTHLESTAKFMGKTPFLFLKNQMRLSWYSTEQLFKPYEFTKEEKISFKDQLRLWQDKNVRGMFFAPYLGRLKCLTSKAIYVDG